ncbi:MAG: calcium/sodium antiporter [Anderseniella sp.]|nr:calcium/sodium antiporter [Anderseniella sp.]
MITTLSLLAGFILLLGGGEYLVRGAGALALRFGLSHLVVGIVIVGFGTSVPELVASVQAAMAGAPGIAMGNVVGSNIANILLILGAGAIIYPVIVSKHAVYRDGVTMVATAALLLIAVWGGVLSFSGGLLFVILLATYLTYLIYSDRKQNGGAKEDDEDDDDLPVPSKSVWFDLVMVAGGILAVVGGGKLLVDNAIVLAKTFNVSDEVIGLTLVSVGTSLPELATSVMAAIRKHSDIALGNVLGSNVYNILGIAGITALIKPIPVTQHMVQIDIPLMIGVSLILFFLAVVVKRFGKRVGYAFLAAYIGYIYLLVA